MSGGGIRAQFIGDHPSRWAALLSQVTGQQAHDRLGVAAPLDDAIEHIPILIHGAPQPVRLAGNRDHDPIEMPYVARAWRPAPEAASIIWPELLAPSTDCLLGDDDTALEQHLLDQPQARWEPVAFTADRLGLPPLIRQKP
jgi:hypothetical protein